MMHNMRRLGFNFIRARELSQLKSHLRTWSCGFLNFIYTYLRENVVAAVDCAWGALYSFTPSISHYVEIGRLQGYF